jgi:L-lactate dehydrogenase (cytochrome)
VLLGRAWAYALGEGGQPAVAHMLRLIEAEMRVAMALTGATAIAEIDGSRLV